MARRRACAGSKPTAIVAGLGGARPLDAALAEHQRLRDRAVIGMYDFTTGLTRFRPRLAETALLESLRRKPAEIDRFLGVIAGAIPVGQYLAPVNALRLIGLRGLLRLAGKALSHHAG